MLGDQFSFGEEHGVTAGYLAPQKECIPGLGHTKLILCFTDCLGQKHDPVGRQKNKNKNDQTSHEFN